MVIVKILVFVLMLGTIILIHEFGHFFFAKRAGILCHEFSIGMGPVIYKKKKGETTFCIRAIPIGGFVSMAGEQVTADTIKPGMEIGINVKEDSVYELVLSEKKNADIRGKVVSIELYGRHGEALEVTLEVEDVENSTEAETNTKIVSYPVNRDAFYVFDDGNLQIAPFERSFEGKPLRKRFLSIVAGPLMNFVLAIFIYLAVYFVSGVPNYGSRVVGEVSANFPSAEYLVKNDEILKVNGLDVSSWNDFSSKMDNLALEGTEEIELVVKRGSEELTFSIPNIIVVNSIAISNSDISEEYKDNKPVVGAMVGYSQLTYSNNPGENVPQISNGDIITEINIVDYYGDYDEAGWVTVDSWSTLVKQLVSVSASKIYFKFYDQQTSQIQSTYQTSGGQTSYPVESYSNEVLENQRIEKVSIYIGVSPVYHHNFFGMIKAAFQNFWNDFTLIFNTLKLLIAPSEVRQIGVGNLSGVVGIYGMIGSYLEAGPQAFFLFVALLSVNIGVMNLLPIPALDGGRIVFLAYEGVTRKPINRKVEAWINNIMFIILMIFMLYITWNDITRLFG